MPTYLYATFNIMGVRRGDTFEFNFNVKPEDMDLTGATARCQVRDPDNDRLIVELDVELDGQDVMMTKAKEDMRKLKPGLYDFDVQYTFPDGSDETPHGGKFEIVADTTR